MLMFKKKLTILLPLLFNIFIFFLYLLSLAMASFLLTNKLKYMQVILNHLFWTILHLSEY